MNADLIQRIDDKLDEMEEDGINLLFWKVDRAENEMADSLAKQGVDW